MAQGAHMRIEDQENLVPMLCRALKGLSPSHSQQLELEDALASTAYMDGPCGPPDDGLSKQPALWRCFASCINFWGAPVRPHAGLSQAQSFPVFDLACLEGGQRNAQEQSHIEAKVRTSGC